MARKLKVDIEGDSSSLQRSFRKAGASSKHFERDLARGTRGIIAASGALGGLTRALALGSMQFVAGAMISAGIRDIIDEAKEQEVTLADMEVALKSAGLSWKEYGKTIVGTADALSKATGFEDTELLGTFKLFLRGTKDVRKANLLNALAVNVARGSNKDLASSAKLVMKAAMGQSGALRRLGLNIDKNATSQEILNFLQKRFAGAAAAYAKTAQGAQDRFHAAVQNLEERIGMGLLPRMTEAANAAADWIGNTKNQEIIIKAINDAIYAMVQAWHGMMAVMKPVAKGLKVIIDRVGGIKNAIILAGGAFLGFKAIGITTAIAVSTANVIAAGVTSKAWKAALISTGWGAFAVAAGAAAAYVVTHWDDVKFWFNQFWIDFQIGWDRAIKYVVDRLNELIKALTAIKIFGKTLFEGFSPLGGISENIGAEIGALQGKKMKAGYIRALKEAIAAKGKKKDKSAIDEAFKDFLNWDASGAGFPADAKAAGAAAGAKRDLWMEAIDRRLDRLQDLTLKKQLVQLKAIAKLLVARIATIKDVQKKLDYEDKLLEVIRQAKQTRIDIASEAMDALNLGLEKAGQTRGVQDDIRFMKQMIKNIQERIKLEGRTVALQRELYNVRMDLKDAKQFAFLGLDATGGEKVPGPKGLRARLGNIQEAVKGTFLDTQKTRTMLQHIRKILAGGLGKISKEVRAKIKEILDDFDKQLKDKGGDQTKFVHANTRKVLAGLGLDPDEARRVRQRIAQLGAGNTVPGGTTGAYGGAGAMTINTVNVYGVQDARQFEREMNKRSRSRPRTRRGGGV